MRKIFSMLLAACILLTAAGCNGGRKENTPPDTTNGSGKATTAQSLSQEPTASAPAETAQVDAGKISFKHTTVSPDWKPVEGFNAQYDCTLLEDEQGTLHLIYNDYSLHMYHRFLSMIGSDSAETPVCS